MIRRIRIQNFKSLRDVTVELSPVTVLVGRSGTGKSNFVTAIRFLRDLLLSGKEPNELAQVYGGAQLLKPMTFDKEETPLIQFEVDFDIPGFDGVFSYSLRVNSFLNGPVSECLKLGQRTFFRQGRDVPSNGWDVPPAVTPLPKRGQIAIGRLPGLQEVVLANAALTVGIGVYHFPQNVMVAAGGNGVAGLNDDGSNFLSVIKDLTTNWQHVSSRREISTVLQRVNSTVGSIELDSIQAPTAAIVGHRFGQNTMTLNLNQESDGFRRFYAHLLALYQTPPKQTVIFEEPENGIHPGALALLADEFNAAPDAGRGQVLLTTQSPGLLDHFSTDQIRVVDLVDLETRIGPLDEGQRSAIQDHLLRPGELLTTDPARLQGASS
ncbi:MAG: AAA family ATPase [Planctomycetaceae bacterium]